LRQDLANQKEKRTVQGMKRTNNKVFILMSLIFIAGLITGNVLHANGYTDNSLVEDINTVLMSIISIVALIVALITYFSIDGVDKKNKMDGNVLEMSNYNISYPSMIADLNVSDAQEYENWLTENIITKPSINSSMLFSEWIQNIIDHIIWFAYYSWDDKTKARFMKTLDSEYEKYCDIGSQSKLILEENIKLIKCIITYQEKRRHEDYSMSSIEEVRYSLLQNPIAKIVFYDYLGLDYRKYVSGMMNCQVSADEFSVEYFEEWKAQPTGEKHKDYLFFINRAIESFSKAAELAKDDDLWKSYISYNLVRCKIMVFLLSEKSERDNQIDEIMTDLDKCVTYRSNMALLVCKNGYLYDKFQAEIKQATRLKDNFTAVFGK